jgi:hypothetical protein
MIQRKVCSRRSKISHSRPHDPCAERQCPRVQGRQHPMGQRGAVRYRVLPDSPVHSARSKRDQGSLRRESDPLEAPNVSPQASALFMNVVEIVVIDSGAYEELERGFHGEHRALSCALAKRTLPPGWSRGQPSSLVHTRRTDGVSQRSPSSTSHGRSGCWDGCGADRLIISRRRPDGRA